MDIADPASVAAALACHQPWAVVNTAGYVRVDDAEREPDACFRENAAGAEVLARACAARGIPLVTFSSDLVFDGRLGRAYARERHRQPAQRLRREQGRGGAARRSPRIPRSLIVRTSAFFGPWDRYNFVWAALNALRRPAGRSRRGPDVVSPTYVPDLVHVTLDLLIDGETGVWHLANPGAIAWRDLAADVARRASFDPGLVA